MRRRGRWTLMAAAVCVSLSCAERPTDPDFGDARLHLVPVFRQGSADLPVLPVDELTVQVLRAEDGEVLVDRTLPITPSDVELEIELEVPATPGEALTIDLALRSAGRDVYVGGPLTVVPSADPVEIQVDYVGAGACSTTVGVVNVGPVGGQPGLAEGRLELGDCYQGISDSFADRWTIDLTRDAGLELRVAPSGSASGLRLRLERPDGTAVVDAGLDRIDLFIGAGSYVAVVTSVTPLADVSYALTVREFDRCDSETGTLVAGASRTQALTLIDCPLASGRSADLWGVEVFVDTPYRIDLTSSAFDAQLVLTADGVLDPFLGSPIAEDDDGGLGTDALLAGVLAPGRYRVWATSFSSGETGPYELSMDPLSRGAPRLEVRSVVALGLGGAGGLCSSAQPFRFDFGYEDGDGDLVQGAGVTIRLTGIPSGAQETKRVDWSAFSDLSPYAGYADIVTCETFGLSETGKLVEFFITDFAGRSSAFFSTTIAPPSPQPPAFVSEAGKGSRSASPIARATAREPGGGLRD